MNQGATLIDQVFKRVMRGESKFKQVLFDISKREEVFEKKWRFHQV